MTKFAKLYIALAWAGLIFALLGMPMPYLPSPDKPFTVDDKIVHIFLFGVLAYLIIWFWGENKKIISRLKIPEKKFKKIMLFTFTLCTLLAIGGEYYQAYVPGRDPDFYDLIAGVIGTLIAILYAYYVHTRIRPPSLLLHICCAPCGAYISQALSGQKSTSPLSSSLFAAPFPTFNSPLLFRRGRGEVGGRGVEGIENFRVTLFFYNPNIFPKQEYKKRLKEVKKIARKFKLKLIVGKYNHQRWLKLVKGYEQEPEKGARCLICYRDRLEKTALLARAHDFDYFSTTLTVSPHKNTPAINKIGRELEKKFKVNFLELENDFKKAEGFLYGRELKKPKDFCMVGELNSLTIKFLDQKKQDGFKKSVLLSRELGLYQQKFCGCEFGYRGK
jgi:predicted adenine nucleotide alpha hydrolase (AANH) superfamily ATPase